MEGVDRISNLPDLVLSHILSFLSTKEAVKTSTLSTRWRKISSLLSNLRFEHYDWGSSESDSNDFMSFVDRVLFYRTGNVDKFHLEFREVGDPYRVDGWMRYALLNRVREIEICIHSPRIMEFYRLPLGIFTCETLVVLRLNIFRTDGNNILKVPAKICSPNLKILHLSGFDFSSDNSFQRLFSSCLVLEEFVIDGCILKGDYNICSPTLKRLTITDCGYKVYEISTDVPRLVYLKSNQLQCFLSIKNLNSLVEACVNLMVVNLISDSCVLRQRAIAGLLNVVGNVQSLHLSAYFYAKAFLEEFRVCEFPRVTYLNLDCCFLGGWERVLPYLLTWFPCLEELHVKVNETSSFDTKGLMLPCKEFPSFLWSQLKTFKIRSFKGCKNEYQMILYFLKNALVLEKLIVQSTGMRSSTKRSKITKNLWRLPKASKKCIILVV